MWLWPDLVNLPCCCWSTLWQPRPLSDASLAWSWCPASKSDTTARTFAWIFRFYLKIFFFNLSIDQFAFFLFLSTTKVLDLMAHKWWSALSVENSKSIHSLRPRNNFDIILSILWRHNIILTELLQPTVGFRLGLLHQQSQGLTASLALLEALHTKTLSLTFLAFTRPLETKAKRSLTQLNAKRSNYTLHKAK